jgi:hypothetical protein
MKTRLSIIALLTAITLVFLMVSTAHSFFKVSFSDKDILSPAPPLATEPGPSTGVPGNYDRIVLPSGTSDRLMELAAEELADAVEVRTGSRPSIGFSSLSSISRSIELAFTADITDDEAFRIQSGEQGLTIYAAGTLGLARGMAYVARLLYGGIDEAGLQAHNSLIESGMRYRFVDLGGVGIAPDSAAWRRRDYSHHIHALPRLLLNEPPFIDAEAVALMEEQFRRYVDRVAVYGYNGIVMKGFLEFVDFRHLADGYAVYKETDSARYRHAALREAVNGMIAYAQQMNVSVVLLTDMLALSEPLAGYLRSELGSIDTSDPRLWEVYKLAVRELFETMPEVDGMMIRIGEAGALYNVAEWPYYSTLDVQSPAALRLMLTALGEEASRHEKMIFFRTWSVGVGELGEMHTCPETYDRLFADLDISNLVISTKFVGGDYFSYLPVNATLKTGSHPRMVEFQARREYEFFASFPNFMGAEHQRALQDIGASGTSVSGFWMWTQEGGPQRRSPISLYPFHGFWQLIDADVYIAAGLAWDLDADIRSLAEGWVRRTIGGDDASVAVLADILVESRKPVLKGLYIRPFAARQFRTIGLAAPPLMWIYQWDVLTASSAVMSAIYAASRDELDEAIAEGFEAVDLARAQRKRLDDVDAASLRDPDLLTRLTTSTEYQVDLFETLAAYREAVLHYYYWLDRGGSGSYSRWKSGKSRFEEKLGAHLAVYGNNLDFRALDLFDVHAGFKIADRSRNMARLARVMLAIGLLVFLCGIPKVAGHLPDRFGRSGCRLLLTAVISPNQTARHQRTGWADWLIVAAVPATVYAGTVLVVTSMRAPFLTTIMLLLLAGLALGHHVAVLRSDISLSASLFGPLLAALLLPLAFLSVRGPAYIWYLFWTEGAFSILLLACLLIWWWCLTVIWRSRRSFHPTPLLFTGRVMLATGLPVLLLAGVLHTAGLTTALRTINDELVILPLALPRVLSIGTHVDIPVNLPAGMLAVSLAIVLTALIFISIGYRQQIANLSPFCKAFREGRRPGPADRLPVRRLKVLEPYEVDTAPHPRDI